MILDHTRLIATSTDNRLRPHGAHAALDHVHSGGADGRLRAAREAAKPGAAVLSGDDRDHPGADPYFCGVEKTGTFVDYATALARHDAIRPGELLTLDADVVAAVTNTKNAKTTARKRTGAGSSSAAPETSASSWSLTARSSLEVRVSHGLERTVHLAVPE